jgi:hypothetical protein
MKFNLSRYVSAKVYRATGNDSTNNKPRLLGMFWVNKSNYRYDEYYNRTYSNFDPATGISVQAWLYYAKALSWVNEYVGPYPFREIPATIITHDIGNGESDFQLDKVIFDGQYDTKNYLAYQYSITFPDPKLTIELRATSYSNEVPVLTIDIIKKNFEAVPGPFGLGNPWRSRSNTPGGTIVSSNEKDNLGRYATREALALVVPFSKYRRSRVYVETAQKLTTVRSLQVLATEFTRKTYG